MNEDLQRIEESLRRARDHWDTYGLQLQVVEDDAALASLQRVRARLEALEAVLNNTPA